MTTKFCTAPGWNAAQELRRSHRGRICGAENAFTGTGSNSVKDSDLDELSSRLDEEGKAGIALHRINTFLTSHRAVPTPNKFETGAVGCRIDFTHPDKHNVLQKVSVVLGGEDEPQLYKEQGILVVFYGSPLGRMLVGKRVGSYFEYTKAGKVFDAEISAIGLPPEPDIVVGNDASEVALPLAAVG